MSTKEKREAQSPPSGEEDDLKRRIIDGGAPVLISLDEIPEEEDQGDTGTELTVLRKLEGKKIARNQWCKDKKLEVAHNDLATKVGNSVSATNSNIESLEAKLNETLTANSHLSGRIEQLEDEQRRFASLQTQVNETQSKQMNSLKIEQGFTSEYVHDSSSEVNECKILIAGIHKSPGENTLTVALNCINKVVSTAMTEVHQNDQKEGLKKLHLSDIRNAYRVGKPNAGNHKCNIAVTFVRMLDKELVYRAKACTKGDKRIKFFLNDDVSKDGRTLKAKMR